MSVERIRHNILSTTQEKKDSNIEWEDNLDPDANRGWIRDVDFGDKLNDRSSSLSYELGKGVPKI